jgi:hypothetical protein
MEVVTWVSFVLAGCTAPAHPERVKITSDRPKAVIPLPKPLINVLRVMPISYLALGVEFRNNMAGSLNFMRFINFYNSCLTAITSFRFCDHVYSLLHNCCIFVNYDFILHQLLAELSGQGLLRLMGEESFERKFGVSRRGLTYFNHGNSRA